MLIQRMFEIHVNKDIPNILSGVNRPNKFLLQKAEIKLKKINARKI